MYPFQKKGHDKIRSRGITTYTATGKRELEIIRDFPDFVDNKSNGEWCITSSRSSCSSIRVLAYHHPINSVNNILKSVLRVGTRTCPIWGFAGRHVSTDIITTYQRGLCLALELWILRTNYNPICVQLLFVFFETCSC